MIILLLYALNSMLNKQICLLVILCLQKIILNIHSLARSKNVHVNASRLCTCVTFSSVVISVSTQNFACEVFVLLSISLRADSLSVLISSFSGLF